MGLISRITVLIVVLLQFAIINVSAQDIHFSQFYASPLTLNPTLAGFSEGSYRITGIYRNQWRSVTSSPFQTYGVSFDTKILEQKLGQDILGTGISAVYDKSGEGGLTYLNVMASAAYYKLLGSRSKHYLGAGIQLGFVQRSIGDLFFPSQFNGSELDPGVTGETLEKTSVAYFDMQAGLMWSSNVHERIGVYHGFSIFHLTQPNESFLGNSSKLSSRYTLHGGIRVKVTDKVFVTPNYILMIQNKAKEANVGVGAEYHFNDENTTIIGFGIWHRVKDAAILTAFAEYRNIRIGIAYDINTSSLKPASSNRGAFELSLIYTGIITQVEVPVLKPCPRL